MIPAPPQIPIPAEARFDAALEAWVLTRYADVQAALRDPRLTASGARGGGELDRAAHLSFRSQAADATLEMLSGWPGHLDSLAREMAAALPQDRPVDLVCELAEPWSARVAAHLNRLSDDPGGMTALAGDIFAAAAEPGDPARQAGSALAARQLAAAFPGPLAAFHVQAFVALSQTLPCFLANAWLSLLQHPQQSRTLRAEPRLMPQAIEELLRYCGPSRAQFRRATATVEFGRAAIAQGGRVALMLSAANRDPDRFPDPDRLDLRRDSPRHLAFGDGPHACIGAPLIRAAAATATSAFLECFACARLARTPEWRGGFAISAPACLPVFR